MNYDLRACIIIIIIITTTRMIFMVLSSWQRHCESSPSSFDECRLSAGVAANSRLSQLTWTANPPEWRGSYHPHPPLPFIITQPESWYSFYRPMEGGRLSRPRHCSKGVQPMPKAVYCSGCCDKHNCPWWNLNLGPLTLQTTATLHSVEATSFSRCHFRMSVS